MIQADRELLAEAARVIALSQFQKDPNGFAMCTGCGKWKDEGCAFGCATRRALREIHARCQAKPRNDNPTLRYRTADGGYVEVRATGPETFAFRRSDNGKQTCWYPAPLHRVVRSRSIFFLRREEIRKLCADFQGLSQCCISTG